MSALHQSLLPVSDSAHSPRPREFALGAVAVMLALGLCGTLLGLLWAWLLRPSAAEVGVLAKVPLTIEAEEVGRSVRSADWFALMQNRVTGFSFPITRDMFQRRYFVRSDGKDAGVTVTVIAPRKADAISGAKAFAQVVASELAKSSAVRAADCDLLIESTQHRLSAIRERFSEFKPALLYGDVRTLRQRLAADVSDTVARVESIQARLDSLKNEDRKGSGNIGPQPSQILTAQQQQLAHALTRYTEDHPTVKGLRASIALLEKEQAAGSGLGFRNADADQFAARRGVVEQELKGAQLNARQAKEALEAFATNELKFAALQTEFAALTARRDELIKARVALEGGAEAQFRLAEGACIRVVDPVALFSNGLAGGGIGCALGFGTLVVARRRRRFIRNTAELERVSGTSVTLSLPDLATFSAAERDYWAIQTLQRLRCAAKMDRRSCLVCGVTSMCSGDGRSTWIDLLSQAAIRSGNRVLVVSQPERVTTHETALATRSEDVFLPSPISQSMDLAHFTLVADVGSVMPRKQWERAIEVWAQEDNAEVFIELPPATTPEALLLSAAVPHLLWLSVANVSEASATRTMVETLRSTGCNIIAAGLNRCTALKTWIVAAIGAACVLQANAQVSNVPVSAPPADAETNLFSGGDVPVLSPWQQRLTLGPGDTIEISLYGQNDTTRTTTIAPDGRFSFLQASDVIATDLTVDELRSKLEEILKKFHLSPRVVIVPLSFASKKYFIMGNVVSRGAFVLDKPVTIVEAVARAKGFVSSQRGSFLQADLGQSFLVRRKADGSFGREPVDFEALFLRGDFQQNKFLAPDDYVYFPAIGVEEVYVLGEVRGHGVVPYTSQLTAVGAIAGRGGFTDAAFRQKILVIRGSLNNPETHVIDVAAVLRATAQDFPLKPKDIVYVSRKPWAKAEELLESASSDFVRAIIVAYTGRTIRPLSR